MKANTLKKTYRFTATIHIDVDAEAWAMSYGLDEDGVAPDVLLHLKAVDWSRDIDWFSRNRDVAEVVGIDNASVKEHNSGS